MIQSINDQKQCYLLPLTKVSTQNESKYSDTAIFNYHENFTEFYQNVSISNGLEIKSNKQRPFFQVA